MILKAGRHSRFGTGLLREKVILHLISSEQPQSTARFYAFSQRHSRYWRSELVCVSVSDFLYADDHFVPQPFPRPIGKVTSWINYDRFCCGQSARISQPFACPSTMCVLSTPFPGLYFAETRPIGRRHRLQTTVYSPNIIIAKFVFLIQHEPLPTLVFRLTIPITQKVGK
jgi:hypothetical protein